MSQTVSEFVGVRLYGWLLRHRKLTMDGWVTANHIYRECPVPETRIDQALWWCAITNVIQIQEVTVSLGTATLYRAKDANDIAQS